jgi:hypothetical protein
VSSPEPGGGLRWIGLGAILVGVIAGVYAAAPADPSPFTDVAATSETGVAGTVRPGTDWNVRKGPGVSFARIGIVRSGDHLAVACLDHGWALLADRTGPAFVHASGLALDAVPPPC